MEVDFCILNDLSLPLCDYNYKEQVLSFIKVINSLKVKNINTIRASFDFRELESFTESKNLNQILGQGDIDFSRRLKSLITNTITKFESPLIRDDETKQQEELELNSEYFIDDNPCNTGLACADIWGTFCISFLTSEHWENESIELNKIHIIDEESIVIIQNISKEEHSSRLNFIQRPTFRNVDDLLSKLTLQNSKFSLVFFQKSRLDINSLYEENTNNINRLYDLFCSIQSSPELGIGKPEKLKEDKSGCMSRRVNKEDRIVYKQVDNETVEIYSCKGHYEK
jgi:toxin YoeB